MIKNYKKGFTLIELLVVIAIIGILSAIVLASLNSARDKGKDASAKASISSIRSTAEIYYNSGADSTNHTGGGYKYYISATSNICANADVVKLKTAAEAQTGTTAVCTANSGGLSYTFYDKLKSGQYFCVDSAGNAAEIGSSDPAVTPPTGFSSGVKCK